MAHSPQIPDFANSLDLLIRSGRAAEARAGLKKHLNGRRENAAWLAWIARRTGQSDLSLKILHRWVRPAERGRAVKPSGLEVLEYGAALVNSFATREARVLLGSLDSGEFPEALFFQALASISEWDHESAISWLTRYLAQYRVEPYRKLVGKVNLALSQVLAQRFDEARTQIHANIGACRNTGAHLLLANSLETHAHLEYLCGDLSRAEQAIEAAQQVLREKNSPLRDAFFIEKWRVLVRHRRHPSATNLRKVRELQMAAVLRKDYETARAMDFHLGRDLKDGQLLAKVYFGSPYPLYRERISRASADLNRPIPDSWVWRPGARAMELELVAPERGLLATLLKVLSADHYRPLPLLALHEKLYSDAHFNPQSSRGQLHQLLKRLRRHFEREGIALKIREQLGSYILEGDQPLILRREESPLIAQIRRATSVMGTASFKSSDFAIRFGISKPTAITRIREMAEAGAIIIDGSGPATTYRFCSINGNPQSASPARAPSRA
jgi:hypothetical protein